MTLLRKFLGSLARVGLGVLAGWFVRKGVIESQDADTYVQAAADWLVPGVIAAVPVIWAWMATKARALKEQRLARLVVRAAAAPAHTPLAVLEAQEKLGAPVVVISRNVQVGTPADHDGDEAA